MHNPPFHPPFLVLQVPSFFGSAKLVVNLAQHTAFDAQLVQRLALKLQVGKMYVPLILLCIISYYSPNPILSIHPHTIPPPPNDRTPPAPAPDEAADERVGQPLGAHHQGIYMHAFIHVYIYIIYIFIFITFILYFLYIYIYIYICIYIYPSTPTHAKTHTPTTTGQPRGAHRVPPPPRVPQPQGGHEMISVKPAVAHTHHTCRRARPEQPGRQRCRGGQ